MQIDTGNLAGLSGDDLTSALVALRTETDRRTTLAQAEAALSRVNTACMAANGTNPGDPWVQPTGATTAYPLGWTATYIGITWLSLIANNATIPGNPADPQAYRWWKDISTPPPTGNGWVGTGHAYAVGAIVTYNGGTYTCLQAHVSQPGWNPMAAASLWSLVAAPPTGGAWDGNAHAYAVGDVVTYLGNSYTCLQAHTSQAGWTPTAVPSLWKLN